MMQIRSPHSWFSGTWIFICAILLIPCATYSQQAGDFTDKIESPYFQVYGAGNHVELPLRTTTIEVNIAGVIADVHVRQEYVNTGTEPLEADYVFPGSTKSAVYGMKMTIGDRTITAKIEKREEAQAQYEAAKAAGQTASLLQQQRPNVFQMGVANIPPGKTVIVELSYTELLEPENATYAFVYPNVVGPRYADSTGLVKDPWVLNPHTNPEAHKQATGTTFSKPTFDISVHLRTGIPIDKIMSQGYETNITFDSRGNAHAVLKQPKQEIQSKDFVLNYRLAGDEITSGLTLYEGEKENFFLMMVEPPKRVEASAIPPREYIFIVDVSGSMNGFPLDVSKALMRDLLSNVRPEDKFNVLLFASGSALFSEASVPATPANLSAAQSFMSKERGTGGTELLSALERALDLPETVGYSRSIVIATDGFVTVEKESFDVIREELGSANFFPFGIGTNVNRFLIEGMARAAQSEPLFVFSLDEARRKGQQYRQYLSSPVLTDIKIDFGDFETYDVAPLSFPDVFAERPIIVFGKWKGKPTGTISVNGISGSGPIRRNMAVADAPISTQNEALKYLWARHRIMELSDYAGVGQEAEYKDEITKLGLDYSLLTQYTSFIAIDTEENADASKSDDDSEQTLQNTQGAGSTPEPHEWALILLVGGLLLFLTWQKYRNSANNNGTV